MKPITREELLLIRLGWRIVAVTTIKPTVVAMRFATGRPLTGCEKTDATWLRGGLVPVGESVPRGRWAYRPGWQRMVIRWAVLVGLVAFVAGQLVSPWVTNVLVVVILAWVGVWRARRAGRATQAQRHMRDVVMPVWEVVAPHMNVDPETSPVGYLWVPADIGAVDAQVQLTLPRGLDADENRQARIDGVMRRLVHPRLVATWEPILRRASWHLEPVSEHVEQNVQPMYETLANLLGMDPNQRGDRWIELPEDFEEADETKVRITLPTGVHLTGTKQQSIDATVRRYLGRNLQGDWSNPQAVVYTKKGTPPSIVRYEGHDDPADLLKLGKDGAGAWIETELQNETPHGFVTAPTRYGKSTTLSVPTAHVRSKGGLASVVDPKRVSFKKTFAKCPTVRVHTSAKSMGWALEEFFLSMVGVEMACENGADVEEFPVRILLIDELGSLMRDLQSTHKLRKSRNEIKSDPSYRNQFDQIAMRGGANRHYMAVGAHQPEIELFGGTEIRSQFGWKIMLGRFNDSNWRKTFGYAKRLAWNGQMKGRGVVGFGQHEDDISEAQMVYMEPDEIIELANSGPEPPEWWTNGQMAPWVTPGVIAEARESAELSYVSSDGTTQQYPGKPADRDPGTAASEGTPPPPPPLPAEIHEKPPEESSDNVPEMQSVASDVTPGDTAEKPDGAPVGQAGKKARAVMRSVADDEPELIIGNRAAAEFLDMTPDNFVRQRRRYKKKHDRLIPGERVTVDGKPCWTQEALRQWQSARPIAGPTWAAKQDEEDLG